MTKSTYPGLETAYLRYREFVGRQYAQKIPVTLTFEEWYNWWMSNGIDKNGPLPRVTRDTLVMLRKDQSRGFEAGNIVLGTYGMNDKGMPSRHWKQTKPAAWVVKDPAEHERYEPWLRAKAQSMYRQRQGLEEGPFELTFEDWLYFWTDETWPKRGRGANDLALAKIDYEKGWSRENCELMNRREQVRRANQFRKSRGYRREGN